MGVPQVHALPAEVQNLILAELSGSDEIAETEGTRASEASAVMSIEASALDTNKAVHLDTEHRWVPAAVCASVPFFISAALHYCRLQDIFFNVAFLCGLYAYHWATIRSHIL